MTEKTTLRQIKTALDELDESIVSGSDDEFERCYNRLTDLLQDCSPRTRKIAYRYMDFRLYLMGDNHD